MVPTALTSLFLSYHATPASPKYYCRPPHSIWSPFCSCQLRSDPNHTPVRCRCGLRLLLQSNPIRLSSNCRRSPHSARFVSVYVSCRAFTHGVALISQGLTLKQAINYLGVTFLPKTRAIIRLKREFEADRTAVCLNSKCVSTGYSSPILTAGDILRFCGIAISAGMSLLNEVATLFVGSHGLCSTLTADETNA